LEQRVKDKGTTQEELLAEIRELRKKVVKLEEAADLYQKELKKVRKYSAAAGFLDQATRLLNKDAFRLLAEHQLRIAEAKQRPMLLIIARLEKFAMLREQRDEAGLNRALLDAADVIRETFRKSDILARFEEDRFAIFAVEAAKDMARKVLDRLKRGIEVYKFEEKDAADISMGFGTAVYDPETPMTLDQMIGHATVSRAR
jgi:diguanylate cyclase (GGDEF)-like protein